MSAPSTRRRRLTAHQRAVLELLRGSENFRSAQQLHHEMRAHQTRIGLATVYRILHTLAEEKIAETQRAEDGETLYRLRTSPAHRHYLLCRRCGRAVEFTSPDIESCATQLAQEHRYADVSHRVDIYGTCPRCCDGATQVG